MKIPRKRLSGRFGGKTNNRCIAGITLLLAFVLQIRDAEGASVYTPLRDLSPGAGDYTRIPFGLEELHQPSSRYQQVYRSTEFMAASGGGPVLITLFAFRPDNEFSTGFDAILPSVEILMGVTSRGPDELSERFAENATNGMTVVWAKGPLRLVVPNRGNLRISPQVPYVYNPREGNLLLEIRHYEPVPPPHTSTLDFPHVLDLWNVQGDAVSRVYAFDVNATNGIADTGGLTTSFVAYLLEQPPVSISVVRQSTNLVFRWPVKTERHVLQQSPALGTGESWTPAVGTRTDNGTNREMVLPLDSQAAAKFYRLYLPPLQVGAGSQPLTGSTSINIP